MGLHSGKTLDLVYTVGVNKETLSKELFSSPRVRKTGRKSTLPKKLAETTLDSATQRSFMRARFEESVRIWG